MILGDNTYYVSSSTTDDDCPQPCHPLSYYITDTATYFTSNATFIFMEGEHLLDSKGLVQVVINNVDNLTLRGERGHSKTDIIIRCSSNTCGLIFNNSMIINIYDVSITGCGQDGIPPLLLTNITSLYIHHIMLYNNMYNGTHFGGILYIYCVTNTTITDSTFTNNIVGGDGGGLYIGDGTDNVTITNSTFTNNTVGVYGGGLCIYGNGTDITVTNSGFTNNTVGWYGGGLYIIYGDGTDITVTNSAFTNNTVGQYGGGLCIDGNGTVTIFNSAFTNNTVGGYGGGLYIYGDGTNITVTNSAFTNNTGGWYGGGLYIDGDGTNLTITNSAFTNYNAVSGYGGGLYIYGNGTNITVTNSAFTNNTVHWYGGGLCIYGDGTDITVTNSAFTNNTVGGYGGGLYIDGNGFDITVTNSSFTNNTVSRYGGGLCIYGDGTDITVTNSAFTNNTIGGHGGGLYIDSNTNSYMYIITSIFADNNGSGILAHSHVTVIFTEGHSIVANNSSPTDGGGIYLGEDCYLTTSYGGHVSFINNTAQRYGGAIYSHDNNDYSLLHSYFFSDYGTHYNYYNGYFRIHTYHQCTINDLYLSADFTNNSAAIAGDQLYGGVFIFCHISGKIYEDHLDVTVLNNDCPNVPDTIKNVTSIHPLSPISSDPLVVCPCVNGTVDCTVRSLDREVYPGQMLQVPLVTVGLCGGVNPGAIIVEYGKHINLISSATTDYTSPSCTTLNYTVKLIDYNTSNTLITFNVDASGNYNINKNQPIHVHLTILPCPLGLVVDFATGDCVCSNDITHTSGQVICNISWMPHPIQRSGNNWIYHQDTDCTIAYTGCPFDYCNTLPVKINLNQSDLQCNYNRSGILCGQCQPGLSLMLGSNRCANCTDTTLVSLSINCYHCSCCWCCTGHFTDGSKPYSVFWVCQWVALLC